MDEQQCSKALTDYLYKKIHIEKVDSKSFVVPKLIKDVWWIEAASCHKFLWSTQWIKNIIRDVKNNPEAYSDTVEKSDEWTNTTKQHWSAIEESELNTSDEQEETTDSNVENLDSDKLYESEIIDDLDENKTTTKTTTQYTQETKQEATIFDDAWATFLWYLKMAWIIIWSIIAIILLFSFLKYILAFLYDVLFNYRVKFIKVVLPRWDSKLDREREKEVAKDMKEKISRMAQVFRNFHKLWQTTVLENILRFIFDKPKVSLILHYENGKAVFVMWSYPEYLKIIEWAISAQYPEASIETTWRPVFFKKKYTEIIPMQTIKDSVYPIRIFKQLEDDPINNLIDAIWKVPIEDTFSMILTIKPDSDKFNKRAQAMAEWLFKKDKATLDKMKWRKKLFMPWTWFDFLIYWPSAQLIKTFAPGAQQWDPFIRMPKAEEEALNTMAEEAWKPAFTAWFLIVTSSDYQERPDENKDNVMSAFSVYKDEYNNWLDQPEVMADIFWFLTKPMWRFACRFLLTNFFYRKAVFTVDELASLFHFPDSTFNRSPIITWLDYKVLPLPDGLPVLKEPNDYCISWVIAEEYKKWDIWAIFSEYPTWASCENFEETEILEEVDKVPRIMLEWKEIIKKDWINYVKLTKKTRKVWLRVFKDWTLLGINSHRNRFTPVYIKKKDRSRHHYIIWKSGWGKSVFISSLARQDIWNGEWICVIDPHGDLVEDILAYIPKERAKDVIYFDAWNEERPMWLNLYEIDSIDQADRVVNDATEIFLKMFWPEIFWPRIQEYFKYWSLTLLEDMEDGATLIDVPRLFTDEIFREYKIKKVRNPIVRNFWERTYNAMGDREKQEIIPYFTSKFVSFTTNRLIRNIIWQTKSAFRFREAMDEGKILLVNLSKWKIWEINAQLLGMVLVSQIYNAAMSRANVPEDQRKDFYLYVDEFQNFVTWTFSDILSEARKYHLALIMAHQYIAQLESNAWNNMWDKWWKNSVKDAVFGNVWTMQSFKVGAPDAEFLEKEYAPVLSAQDIVWISNYKVYMKLNINNSTSRVFSVDTIWTTDYRNLKVAEILKEYSGKKYWRKKEFVEAEITARLWMLEEIDEEDWNSDSYSGTDSDNGNYSDDNDEWQW